MPRTPDQIFAVYQAMFDDAATIRDFQIAAGEKGFWHHHDVAERQPS